MSSTFYFNLIIGILITNFIFDKFISFLNAKHFSRKIPKDLSDLYDATKYASAQKYKKSNYTFELITSTFSFLTILFFIIFGGFSFVDTLAKSITLNPIGISLLFFGILMLGNEIITLPFSYYQTFFIETEFGFNKSSKQTFWLDKIKSLLLGIVLGGIILAAINWFYLQTTHLFWTYAWALITGFSLLMNLFYAQFIVPIFNKQTPLEDGLLKDEITSFGLKVGFSINNIYVIDGSKRSTKANAYFSGFGSQKRITLYDTLINDLSTEEIVAVLAHEIGHYKKKHIVYNLILSTLLTGISLYILSLLIGNDAIANGLGLTSASFHIGLVAFGFLYAPISEITGVLMHFISRKFEYQADDFAKKNYSNTALITALKTLSKKSLSNLTPHPWYVFVHYSHPSLLERIHNLKKESV